MSDRTNACFMGATMGFFALVTGGCSTGLPAALSTLPEEIDVFRVEFQKKNLVPLRFLGVQKQGSDVFKHRVTHPQTKKVSQSLCQRSFSPSKMCQSMEVVCRDEKKRTVSQFEVRQDGRFSVRLGPPWESTPDDLVEVGMILVDPIEDQLYAQREKILHAQLTEGIVEPQTLTHQSQPLRESSSWFNQLSVTEEGVFVAIHRAHPYPLQALAALNLMGKIWKANSSHFEDCGFSSN